MALAKQNVSTNKCFKDNSENDYEENVSSSDFQTESVIYDVLSESIHQKQDSPNFGKDEVIITRDKTSEKNITVLEKFRNTRFSVRIVGIIFFIVFINIITGISTYFLVKSSESDKNAVTCFWTDWSSWSSCSCTCDGGIRNRIKQYIGQGGDDECQRKENRETQICTKNENIICTGDTETIHMKFNTSTLYRLRFISNDNRTLSNVYTLETPNSPDGTFNNYRGVSADICVRGGQRIYFEVEYAYEVIAASAINWMVFEVGLAELSKTDNNYSVAFNSVGGWAFHVVKSENNAGTDLQAMHNTYDLKSERIGGNSIGSKLSGKFDFFVDRVKNQFSLVKNLNVFYTFKGVLSATDLCPVFGVYNPHVVSVQLKVLKSRNFTDYPLFVPE